MSQVESKYLLDYSLATLRDVLIAGVVDGDYIVFDSVSGRFVNRKPPRFGTDFFEKTVSTPAGQQFTGTTFNPYDNDTFAVSGPDTTNKYRISCQFICNHNSASNDFRARLLVDGQQVGEERRVEPKDAGADQRPDYEFKWYLNDLSIGNHTYAVEFRPATGSRITRVYQSITEIWRVN